MKDAAHGLSVASTISAAVTVPTHGGDLVMALLRENYVLIAAMAIASTDGVWCLLCNRTMNHLPRIYNLQELHNHAACALLLLLFLLFLAIAAEGHLHYRGRSGIVGEQDRRL